MSANPVDEGAVDALYEELFFIGKHRHDPVPIDPKAIIRKHLAAALQQGQAASWQQGYHQGVQDERTSEANIGIAGFDAKVEPARINPYIAQQAQGGGQVPESVELDYTPGVLDRTAPPRIWLQIDTSADNSERDDKWPEPDGVSWCWESVGGLEVQYVRADLAQQPAAVDEAMVFRLAVWMAKHDGHDDPHHLIWEGSPPEPWGEVWNRYEDDARAALTAALATQQQGQAACVACEGKPAPENSPCGWCGRTTPQPTQQGQAKDTEIDALRTRLEDTIRDSTNEIETLKAEAAAQRTRADAMAGEAIKHEARAERLAEAGRRVTAAFRAFGEATAWTRSAEQARHECEAAMLALDAALEQEAGSG